MLTQAMNYAMASFVFPCGYRHTRPSERVDSAQLFGYSLPISQQLVSGDDVVVILGRMTDLKGPWHKARTSMSEQVILD